MVPLCASWAVLERATSALAERPLLFALCVYCRRMGLCLLREVIDLWPWPCFIWIPHGCICSRVKQLLETAFLPSPTPPHDFPAKLLPWSVVNNACGGDSGPKSYLLISVKGLGGKKKEKVMSFHESSLIMCNRKRNLMEYKGIYQQILRYWEDTCLFSVFWVLKHSDFDAQFSMP